MREYEIEVQGIPHRFQLDDETAKEYGDRAKPVDEKAAEKPANRARSTANKSKG